MKVVRRLIFLTFSDPKKITFNIENNNSFVNKTDMFLLQGRDTYISCFSAGKKLNNFLKFASFQTMRDFNLLRKHSLRI